MPCQRRFRRLPAATRGNRRGLPGADRVAFGLLGSVPVGPEAPVSKPFRERRIRDAQSSENRGQKQDGPDTATFNEMPSCNKPAYELHRSPFPATRPGVDLCPTKNNGAVSKA